MAGKQRPLGPPSKRVAANLRSIRRERDVTTAALSQRLAAIGHPIADTGITKTEKGDRRVDADDLVAIALALGVTPNTLLMPEVWFLDAPETYQLTPAVSGNVEQLWQWAQGESPLRLPVPDLPSPLDGHGAMDFVIRSRPYLAAARAPGGEPGVPELRDLSVAVTRALKAGAKPTDVRRVAEMTMTRPVLMKDAEIEMWLEDYPRPDGEEGVRA
jgi:transcriptional regulator with XRE-family HTH domain